MRVVDRKKVLGATFEINARKTFAYTKGRLTAPNHYYRESFDGWKVELPGKDALFAQ
ncbi:MAG TPA: hypothetical protein VIX42_12225 [Edaphobacter sp.]